MEDRGGERRWREGAGGTAHRRREGLTREGAQLAGPPAEGGGGAARLWRRGMLPSVREREDWERQFPPIRRGLARY